MESAAIASDSLNRSVYFTMTGVDNTTSTPESSTGLESPVAISSPTTSPSSSTSSQKRKREEGEEGEREEFVVSPTNIDYYPEAAPRTLTPPAIATAVASDTLTMWSLGCISRIWRAFADWSSPRRAEETTEMTEAEIEQARTSYERPESKRPRLSEDESLPRSSGDEIASIPKAIRSRGSSKRFQGNAIRDSLKIKAPAPSTTEGTVATQQLPSPQASASGDEHFSKPPRKLARETLSGGQKVPVNCPIVRKEEPFYAVPIKKKMPMAAVLVRAVGRRDERCTTRLAEAGYPASGVTPRFPRHMGNKPGWTHKVSWKSQLTPAAQSIFQSPWNDRRLRLASVEKSVASGRVQKTNAKGEKEKKKRQEALRKSQMRAHVESEPLDVLLEQLRARGEHGFLNLREVERRRKEREIEIKKLRAEDARKKIKKEVILPLDAARKERMEKTFAELSRTGFSKTYITKWNIPITNRDFERLRPNQWLNDEIINFYMNLICERTNSSFPDGPKKVFAHNTYFWPKLKSGGHKAVARWARRAKCGGDDVLTLDFLLMPAHVGGNHWCLAVVNFKRKRFEYYDSLGGKFTPESRPGPYKMMREYVREETGGKFDDSGWTDYAMPGAPQQQNMSDCGVFTLKSAEVLTRNGRLDFTASDIPLVRSRMLIEVLEGKLLPPGNP